MQAIIEKVRAQAQKHLSPGKSVSLLPRFSLFSSTASTCPIQALYEPMFCLVLQGAKEVLIGEQLLRYDTGSCFVGSVELPVSTRILEASQVQPYIALTLTLDLDKVATLAAEFPPSPRFPIDCNTPGFGVKPVTSELIEPWSRLFGLLDTPEDIPALAPMIERELLYRLLTGPHQNIVRQLVGNDSRIGQVRRAINWIRSNYVERLSVNALADHAGMSQASLHRHFRSATGITPLQYQKRLRLQEARLKLLGGADVSKTAYSVGYESPSQFSREYARLFGQAPSVDAQRLRSLGASAEQISTPPC
ncbi:AraC family transcriptional regulator [Marinobacterium mangrovicola]|uniref:AraC-like DNA-binding protein n=1 Tax=Marinobacterium mangrovicola TaxID=1476959 RepID=A0A4R1GBX0_9GAMM|nr:AraC family transcriptional regulator [Marinobacterium mangrovicola]TCK04231.1 AraC-like DNA-binding protein [Marinobacterium mangrovicola]